MRQKRQLQDEDEVHVPETEESTTVAVDEVDIPEITAVACQTVITGMVDNECLKVTKSSSL